MEVVESKGGGGDASRHGEERRRTTPPRVGLGGGVVTVTVTVRARRESHVAKLDLVEWVGVIERVVARVEARCAAHTRTHAHAQCDTSSCRVVAFARSRYIVRYVAVDAGRRAAPRVCAVKWEEGSWR